MYSKSATRGIRGLRPARPPSFHMPGSERTEALAAAADAVKEHMERLSALPRLEEEGAAGVLTSIPEEPAEAGGSG